MDTKLKRPAMLMLSVLLAMFVTVGSTPRVAMADHGTTIAMKIAHKKAGWMGDLGHVGGYMCVLNSGTEATENLAITAQVTGPDGGLIGSSTVGAGAVIPPGQIRCFSAFVVFANPQSGGTYVLTAHATITNYEGHLGEPFGPTASKSVVFP
jgi:hypothetical protein